MNFVLIVALSFCCTVTCQLLSINTCASIYRREAQIVSCAAFGAPVDTGLTYVPFSLQYYPMVSPYYAGVMADVLGYSGCCYGNNGTWLEEFQIASAWSGMHGPVAIDTALGYYRNIIRQCDFPSAATPQFVCRGTPGTPETRGQSLGTVVYTTLMHDNVNHEWTLFGVCHTGIVNRTSFIVISTKMTLPPADRTAILAKVSALGFRTDNVFEPDFTAVSPKLQC